MLEIFCKISAAITTRRNDENGASAVEYGLLVAGIAALIVAVVFLFGGMISGVFTDTCGKINAAATCK
jgi:pilus assembly protein Flp/PilA